MKNPRLSEPVTVSDTRNDSDGAMGKDRNPGRLQAGLAALSLMSFLYEAESIAFVSSPELSVTPEKGNCLTTPEKVPPLQREFRNESVSA